VDTTRVHPETEAGDPFSYAGENASREQDPPHAYDEGWVFLTYTAELDGEENEVVEAVPCRRCGEQA
jgi:hypothetical protein